MHKQSKKEVDAYITQLSSQLLKFTEKFEDSRDNNIKELRKMRDQNSEFKAQLLSLMHKVNSHDDKFFK